MHIPRAFWLLFVGLVSTGSLMALIHISMDHYQALLLNKLTRIEGVTGVHSSFVLRQVVVKTAQPVASGVL